MAEFSADSEQLKTDVNENSDNSINSPKTQEQIEVLTSTPVRPTGQPTLDASDLSCDITAVIAASTCQIQDDADTAADSSTISSPSHLPHLDSASDVTSTCHELTASHNSGTQTEDDVTALYDGIRAPILGFEVMEQRARFTVRNQACL